MISSTEKGSSAEATDHGQTAWRLFAILLLFAFVLVQLHPLANFTLSIDDELAAVRSDSSVWVAQGRWTVFVLETFFLKNPVLPFLPTALFGLFSIVGYIFAARALGESTPGWLLVGLFVLFASFPSWTYLTVFLSNAPAAGIAVMVTGTVPYFMRRILLARRGRTFGLYGVFAALGLGFMGAIAVASYQSFFLAIVVMIVATLFAMYLGGHRDRALSDILYGALVLMFVLGTYAVIQFFFMHVTGTDLEYIDSFVRPGVFFADPVGVTGSTLEAMASWYLGGGLVYGHEGRFLGGLLFLSIWSLLAFSYKNYALAGAVYSAAATALFLGVPFGLHLLIGGYMPARSMVAVPFAVLVVALIGLRHASRPVSVGGGILLVGTVLSFLVTNSNLHASRQTVWQHDVHLARAIWDRVEDVASGRELSGVSIEFAGHRRFEGLFFSGPPDSTIGASFFGWDQAVPERIVAFLSTLGFPRLKPLVPERRWEVLDELMTMSPWPAKGAVRMSREGVLLVRLSEELTERDRTFLRMRDPASVNARPPLYEMSPQAVEDWNIENVAETGWVDDAFRLRPTGRPAIIFSTGHVEEVARCSRIELHAKVRVQHSTAFLVYFLKTGQGDFEGLVRGETVLRADPDGGFVEVYLQLISREGFLDRFRVDPVWDVQELTLGSLTLTCMREEVDGRR